MGACLKVCGIALYLMTRECRGAAIESQCCCCSQGVRERARVFETWCCGILRVFRQHNSLQLFHECDRCAQQRIEGAPTGGKALPTEALVPSPLLPACMPHFCCGADCGLEEVRSSSGSEVRKNLIFFFPLQIIIFWCICLSKGGTNWANFVDWWPPCISRRGCTLHRG